MIVAFIDDHKHEHGVEPICRVLTTHGIPIAPSTYYAVRVEAGEPARVDRCRSGPVDR